MDKLNYGAKYETAWRDFDASEVYERYEKEERTVSIILFKAPMNKTDIYKWEAPVCSVYK